MDLLIFSLSAVAGGLLTAFLTKKAMKSAYKQGEELGYAMGLHDALLQEKVRARRMEKFLEPIEAVLELYQEVPTDEEVN